MKKLNLKNAMAAYRALLRAKEDVRFYERLTTDFAKTTTSHGMLDACKAKLQQAEADLLPLLVPISDAIKEAEGRATVRTIDADDILHRLAQIEDTLHISKKAMQGVVVSVDLHAQTFPNAYKYQPQSTQFVAEFAAGHWSLLHVFRGRCGGPRCEMRVTLTDEAKAALISRFTELQASDLVGV